MKHVISITILLALIVVGLGAYTRLTNAGLGCPDWPGCYGQLHLSKEGPDRIAAQARFPNQPIEETKAWTEMIHRYLAGSLGLLIIGGFIFSVWLHIKNPMNPIFLPAFLCVWLFFQAALGMWTVTWRLLPIVVMGHLLSGTILFVGLCLWRCELSEKSPPSLPSLRPWFLLGALLVFCQMALGGWVSANYAGVACIGFPLCNGSLLPLDGLKDGLHLFSSIGQNYQGGILQSESRAAIQVLHRMGAVVTALYLFWLIYQLQQTSIGFWKKIAWIFLGLLFCQWTLGILNVVFFLPLTVAVMHNLVAVLLLSFTCLCFFWSGHEPRMAKRKKRLKK